MSIEGEGKKGSSAVRLLAAAVLSVLAMMLGFADTAHTHSVGQVQTTKYFTPETVQMLIDHANAGSPGVPLAIRSVTSSSLRLSPTARRTALPDISRITFHPAFR